MGNNIKMRYIVILFVLTFSAMFAFANEETEVAVPILEETVNISSPHETAVIESEENVAEETSTISRSSLTFDRISVTSDHLSSYFSGTDRTLELTGNIILQIRDVSTDLLKGTVKIKTDRLYITDNMSILRTDGPIEMEIPLIYLENSPPSLPVLATAKSLYYNANAKNEENILLIEDLTARTYNEGGKGITHVKLKADTFTMTGDKTTTISGVKPTILGMNLFTIDKYQKTYVNTESFFSIGKTPTVNYNSSRGLIVSYNDTINITNNTGLYHHLGFGTKSSFDWLLSLDHYNKIGNIPIKVSLIESFAEYDTGKRWVTKNTFRSSNYMRLKVNRTPVANISTMKKINLFNTIYTDLSMGGGTFYENLSGKKDNILYGILNFQTKSVELIGDDLNLSFYGGIRAAGYDKTKEDTFTTVYGTLLETDDKKPLYLGASYAIYDQKGNTPFKFDKLSLEDMVRLECDYKLSEKLGERFSVNAVYSYSPAINEEISRDIGIVYSDYVLSYTLSYDTLNNGFSFGVAFNNQFSFRKKDNAFKFPFQN